MQLKRTIEEREIEIIQLKQFNEDIAKEAINDQNELKTKIDHLKQDNEFL